MSAPDITCSEETPVHAEVLDVDAAADLLQVSATTVYKAARAGDIPGRKFGKLWRFWRPALLLSVAGDGALLEHPMHPSGDPELVGLSAVADLLGITTVTASALVRTGQIPAQRLGGQWRVWWPDVRQLLIVGPDAVTAPTPRHGSGSPSH